MSETSADYCTDFGVAIVCGTRMVEHSRSSWGIKWCFRCLTRVEFHWIVMVPDGPSYYGPKAYMKCSNCDEIDGDLFPGHYRGWSEE